MIKKVLSLALVATAVVVGCAESDPTGGAYTVAFPSTAAAVATDSVQIFVFDVTDQNRASICLQVITTRSAAPGTLAPTQTAAPVNICEMNLGQKPITFAYGEHAILAVGQRKDAQGSLQDFLIGCAVMTIGEGDAPLPIPVHLVSAGTPVPVTKCGSVGEFCGNRCG